MTRGQVYLIDNVTSDIPPDEMVHFKHKMEELARQGAAVIYLTVPRMIELKTLAKTVPGICTVLDRPGVLP
jgi:ABC-type uncharacterized transport system ATPase subunit